jgi:O-Antigen ligase
MNAQIAEHWPAPVRRLGLRLEGEGLRRAVQAVWVPGILVTATASGLLIARGNLLPIGLTLVIPGVVLGLRLRPVHWIVVWLVVGGLLAWAPGRSLPGGLPELTAERLGLVLVLTFAATRCFSHIGRLWIWPALFCVDYLIMAGFDSPNLREALLTFLRHYVTAFVLFLVAVVAMRDRRARESLLHAVPIVGGVVALVALVQPLAGWDFGVDPIAWGSRLGGTLESPPVLGAGLSVLLFLSLFDVIGGTPHHRLVALCACALMLGAILLTFTRAAWLSVLVGLITLGLVAARRRPGVGMLLLVGVAIIVVFGRSLITTLSDDARLQDDANAVGRLDTSVLSAQRFLEQPVFGWGPLTVVRFDTTSGYGDWVSHDSFLTILVANGLVGGIFYFGPAFFALGRGIRTVVRSDDPLHGADAFALAGAVAYVVNAVAIDMRYFAYPHVLFWICLGVLVARRPATSGVVNH